MNDGSACFGIFSVVCVSFVVYYSIDRICEHIEKKLGVYSPPTYTSEPEDEEDND